jgi:diguanylate cyclase (GGDEF)-like protein
VVPTVGGAASLLAGLALLVTVAAAIAEGRVRSMADLAGLGILATAFAVMAFDASGNLGLGLGLAFAALAFTAGSLGRTRSLATRRGRLVGLVVAVVGVEACLATILLADGWSVDERLSLFLLLAAAVLLVAAGLASLDEQTRATGLGILATSAAAMAIAGGAGNEILIGAGGVGLASAVLGAQRPFSRRQSAPEIEPALALPALPAPPELGAAPEFDELSRITRELRATLDDLVAARHLIELQRVEIDRASSVDQLTGLANRWTTLDRLRTEAAEARRYTHPVAVVLLDIDGFADLNHEYGLDAGDAVLREIALRLRVRTREADAVGRIGADAFLAVLPHTDEEGAATFANAVLNRLLERRIVTARGEVSVRLSIGIALMRPGMSLSGDDLLAAAEEALDSARAAGGNRIAFDRLHGLARLDERHHGATPGEGADEAAER